MYLSLLKIVSPLRRAFLTCLCLFVLTASVGPDLAGAATPNGIIRQIGTQQILNLWGTNYEMGYAHGYLLADKIRDLVDYYMLGKLSEGDVTVYNALLARDAANFEWLPRYLEEINGMAAGLRDSGMGLFVPRLGRDIDARDIRALNLQEEFFFGCSSLGAWRNATINGETILARNLDFYYDTQGSNANYQLILAYAPAGSARFISFAWPGSVGVYSGMNESGITVMANTGNINNPYGGPFHPVVEVYRTILETTTSGNYLTQPLSSVMSVHENPSEIIQIGSFYTGTGYPVYYIEQSPDIDLIRTPADNGYDHIIATNHFLSVIPPPVSGESLVRYTTLQNGLINLYGSGDGKLDSAEAWGLLRSVANSVAPTLSSMVIRPNRMEFDLGFARVENGIFTAATDVKPTTYTWAMLFDYQQIVALADHYSISQNSVLTVAAPGLLANDTDPEGEALIAVKVSDPSHGTLVLNSDGSFSYTPATGYSGSDSFSYQASDGLRTSSIATVTITVLPASTTLFMDDFSRSSLFPWISQSGSWAIASNVLQGSGTRSAYSYAYFFPGQQWGDYSVEAKVQLPAGAFGGGLGGRLDPATGTHYGAWIYPGGSLGGSNVLKLIKFRGWTSWSGTPMKQIALPAVGTGWHTLKMVFSGSRIQVYYDGTAMIDVTDTGFDSRAPYTIGGISADLWTYTTSYQMGFDDVVVTSLTANQPAATLSSFYLNPVTVKGGTTSQGTVTLTAPAPSGGIVVSLRDNSSSAAVPASVTVASGSTNATFVITTYPVIRSRTVTISATLAGVTKTATLTVTR